MSFYKKVQIAVNAFIENEKLIRKYMEDKNYDVALGICADIFGKLFSLDFEIGYNGKKYELIFSTLNSKERLYELLYLKSYFPNNIYDNWNIVIGVKPIREIEVKMHDIIVDPKEVDIYIKNNNISIYSKKLIPLLKKDKNKALEIVAILLKNTIGDIPFMKYINGVDVLTHPKIFNKMPLIKLPNYLEQKYQDIYNPYDIVNNMAVYQNEKAKHTDRPNKKDVIFGNTSFIQILEKKQISFDDGIEFGYIAFKINSNKEVNQVLKAKQDLETVIKENTTDDTVKYVGDSVGINYCYYDAIVWDKEEFLNQIENINQKVENKIEYITY